MGGGRPVHAATGFGGSEVSYCILDGRSEPSTHGLNKAHVSYGRREPQDGGVQDSLSHTVITPRGSCDANTSGYSPRVIELRLQAARTTQRCTATAINNASNELQYKNRRCGGTTSLSLGPLHTNK